MADDDDRPRDAGSAADPAWQNSAGQDTAWAAASAPDDISELSRDIRAYHREQRTNRRHEKYGKFFGRPTSEPLTLLGTALVLAAIVAAAITLVQPRTPSGSATKLPLASVTTAPATTGGLLPQLMLKDGTRVFPARDLRPAVLALAPLAHNWNGLIRSLTDDAAAYNVPLDVIAPIQNDADAAALAGTHSGTHVYYDTQSRLSQLFGAQNALTLIVINRDGTIQKIVRNVTNERDADLPGVLERMQETKAAAS